MAFATALWFSFLSVALTNKVVLNKIQSIASKVQVATGLVLIVFAVKLLFSNQ
jgi:threonine/homoserine/homoserine lactone efflux protein